MGKLKQELEKIMEDMSPPNIAVIGRTGAGKSSVINAVFGEKLAKTGTGLPVSSAFIRYPNSPNEQSPVVIYDSAGYEMGKEEKFKEDVFKFLEQKKSSIAEQIHLVWYVVHAGLKRFEYFDAEIIARLRSEKVPVLIIISQADLARQQEISKIEETIKNYESTYKLDQFDIIKIAANPIHGEPFGVNELVDKSVDSLPDLYTEAFIARQIVNLDAKKKIALNYIKIAAGSCFVVGFLPLPGTTPLAVISSQTTLCTKIAGLYNYAEWTEILDKVGGLTISSILTYCATSVMDILSFLIPPGALLVGGLAGAAAATYIVTVGLTYTSVFEKLTRQELSGAGKTEIEEFIEKTFKEEFNKYSSVQIRSHKDLDRLEQLA